MGCGASRSSASSPAAQSSWIRHSRSISIKNHTAIQQELQQLARDHLIIGVFGLRGSGKTSLLQSILKSSTQPDAPPTVPLPTPTSSFELYIGNLNGVAIACIDSPGLPCASRAAISSLLPCIERLVWVIDSTADWNFDLSALEMMGLWRELQEARSSRALDTTSTGGGAAAAAVASVGSSSSPQQVQLNRNPSLSERERSGAGRKQTSQQNMPSLHIICSKQVEAASNGTAAPEVPSPSNATAASSTVSNPGPTVPSPSSATAAVSALPTITPLEIAQYIHLPLSFPAFQLQNQLLHGWNCAWPFAKLNKIVEAIILQTYSASNTAVGNNNNMNMNNNNNNNNTTSTNNTNPNLLSANPPNERNMKRYSSRRMSAEGGSSSAAQPLSLFLPINPLSTQPVVPVQGGATASSSPTPAAPSTAVARLIYPPSDANVYAASANNASAALGTTSPLMVSQRGAHNSRRRSTNAGGSRG